MIKIALCFVVLVAHTSVFSQYKCTENGAVSYQDRPCSGAGGQMDFRPAAGNAQTLLTKIDGPPVKNVKVGLSELEMNEAYANGIPKIGMTRDQLNLVMKQPSFVNPSNYSGVLHEQIGYNRGKDVWYVYTESGIVRSIQFQTGGAFQRDGGTVACPSKAEIRDAITSASSITLSEAEKTARWKVIQEMQGCGKPK